MFGSNKKGDNKSSSSSSSAKLTNGTSQKYSNPYAGVSAQVKLMAGASSKSATTTYGSKSTTTTSSSSYGSKYPTSSSSTTQKTSTAFGGFKTDAAPSNSYGKSSSNSGYKSSNFAISSPKITNFEKTALEHRPLTAKPYSSSTTVSKTTTFPMPSSLSTKSTSKYEASHVTYPEFETELRKYNIGSPSDNYGLYKSLRNELPTGSYLTAAKLTTRVNQHSSLQMRNHQTTSTVWTSGGNPTLKGPLATGVVAAQLPLLSSKTPSAKFDESRLKSNSTNDPRKPLAFNPSAPKETHNDNRPLLDDNNRYVCQHRRGFGVIYNFENFQTTNGFSKRDGTQNDVEVLEKLFSKFNVHLEYGGAKKDLTLKELQRSVKGIEKKNLTDYDCLVVVILSHGSNNNSISAKDQLFNLEDTVVGPITHNKTLKGKPKIFIIQACRGDQNPLLQADSACFRLGFDATDIIKCFSTYTNHVAFRDPKNGSIFVQTFSKYVTEYGHRYHIADIMEKVCQEVNKICKQTPEQTSTLTKKFYFGDLL